MALGNIREILDFECLESYNVPEYIVINWNEKHYKYEMINDMIMESNKYEVEYKTIGYKFFIQF